MVQEQYVFDDQGGQVVDIVDATEEQKSLKMNNYSLFLERLSSLSSMALDGFTLTSMVEEMNLAKPIDQGQESFSSVLDSKEESLSAFDQEEQSVPSSKDSIYWITGEKKVASSVPPKSNATHVWYYSGENETREMDEKAKVSVPVWEEIQFDYSQVVGLVSYSDLIEKTSVGKKKELPVYPSPEDAVYEQVESKFTEEEINSRGIFSSMLGNPYYIQQEGVRIVSNVEEMNALEIEKVAFPLIKDQEVGYLNGKDVVEILTNQMISEITQSEAGDPYGK